MKEIEISKILAHLLALRLEVFAAQDVDLEARKQGKSTDAEKRAKPSAQELRPVLALYLHGSYSLQSSCCPPHYKIIKAHSQVKVSQLDYEPNEMCQGAHTERAEGETYGPAGSWFSPSPSLGFSAIVCDVVLDRWCPTCASAVAC